MRGQGKKWNPEEKAHTEDVVLKAAGEFFGKEALGFFHIPEKMRRIVPTEMVHLDARRMHEDFNMEMESGEWFHFEFESDRIRGEDLRRFREYEAVTSNLYQVDGVTYVVCTAGAKVEQSEYRTGINTYRVKIIRMDAENADQQLKQEERKRMQAMLYMLATKFLAKEELMEVKEEFGMTILGQMIMDDGIQKGLIKGENRKLIQMVCKKLGKGKAPEMIASDLEEDIAVITQICDTAKLFEPDYDCDRIYEKLYAGN